jgi:plastocyanin
MTRPMRRLALLLALLATAVTACGGGDDDGGGQGASSEACPDGAVVIRMVDIKFDPADATAEAGQQICWTNEDAIDHDVSAESGADFKSELFGKGKTFTSTVDEPGSVEYVCTIHPGMVGTLTIERP